MKLFKNKNLQIKIIEYFNFGMNHVLCADRFYIEN